MTTPPAGERPPTDDNKTQRLLGVRGKDVAECDMLSRASRSPLHLVLPGHQDWTHLVEFSTQSVLLFAQCTRTALYASLRAKCSVERKIQTNWRLTQNTRSNCCSAQEMTGELLFSSAPWSVAAPAGRVEVRTLVPAAVRNSDHRRIRRWRKNLATALGCTGQSWLNKQLAPHCDVDPTIHAEEGAPDPYNSMRTSHEKNEASTNNSGMRSATVKTLKVKREIVAKTEDGILKFPSTDPRFALQLHSEAITLLRIRNVDDDGTGKGHAAAGAASVDVTPYVKPRDPDSEHGDDTTEHNNQDFNEHEESSHDAESNLCFGEISDDEPDDKLEAWVDHIARVTHKADDLLAASGITSWILRQSQMNWRQARMIADHHEDCWPILVSNWDPARSTTHKRYQKQGSPAK